MHNSNVSVTRFVMQLFVCACFYSVCFVLGADRVNIDSIARATNARTTYTGKTAVNQPCVRCRLTVMANQALL